MNCTLDISDMLDALINPADSPLTQVIRLNTAAEVLSHIASGLIEESDRLLAKSKRLQEEASR